MTPRRGDTEVVGRAKVVHPDGRASTRRGVTYTWLACDVCDELIQTKGLAPDQARLTDAEYRQSHGRPCRMTPHCDGRHVLSDSAGPAQLTLPAAKAVEDCDPGVFL